MTRLHSRSMLWTSASLALACFLGGCATNGGVKGVAQAGPASVLTIVDQTDKRAEAAGVEGVKITAETRPGNGPARVLASTTTNAAGKFSLKVSDKNAMRDQVWITAEKEGYTPLTAPIYLPGDGRVLVVVLGGKRK